MTRATQKEQGTTTLKKNILNILRTFYECNLRLSSLDWEPKCGDNIHRQFFQVQLDWSRRNLLLPTEHASFLDWLSPIAKWISLRFAPQYYFSFRFLNLLFWVCWKNTSSLHVKWKGEDNWKLLLSRSLPPKLIKLKCMHTNVFTTIIEHVAPKVFKFGCR